MIRLEPPAARDWAFPRAVTAIAVLVECGREHGVDDATLLRGTGLAPSAVGDHEQVVTAAQELQVVRNLRRAVPGVSGTTVGSRYHLTTFGIFGFALLSSRTVLEAANLALRFVDLSFAFAIPAGDLDGDDVVVTLDEQGVPDDVRSFLVERDLAAIHTCLDELRPGGVPLRRAAFTHPAPSAGAARSAAAVLGLEPSYGADRSLIAFDAALLAEPLPLGNSQARATAEGLCRAVVSRRRERHGIAQQVRVLVTQHVLTGAPMEVVAADLGLSVRTLRRRLADAGTSYRALLDEVRRSLAEELLASGGLSVEDAALRLGYAEASSFIAAFRRWTGVTPTGWRDDDASRPGLASRTQVQV
ncbi:AraC-like DNA-binding protein [Mumia flava]|uniref:AraC-like DNA-binding protein n=1 Tax=Mumia flava TaxID=1348852 RepID=A0A0B2BJY8_9ACTN|nr:AraC family transcriptional regulator [Mumia flava]PJJ56585.1 AraC-like DNA-binding protein [Mumia flava]